MSNELNRKCVIVKGCGKSMFTVEKIKTALKEINENPQKTILFVITDDTKLNERLGETVINDRKAFFIYY